MENKANKKRRFEWYLLGAIISVLAFMGFYAFNDNLIISVGLSVVCLGYSLFLNSAKGMKLSIIKTLVTFILLAIVIMLIVLLSQSQINVAELPKNIYDTVITSFILLPGIDLFVKTIVIVAYMFSSVA